VGVREDYELRDGASPSALERCAISDQSARAPAHCRSTQALHRAGRSADILLLETIAATVESVALHILVAIVSSKGVRR
jgi:hypothetical protein